ncbi:hypothetical protein K7472_26805 [Streptomyces sp. PTM05]|uniref:ABC transporter permease n=1 Tax=Streptantibioticus parmotrematis TaxID=2873249 RepID=A0ABS7QYY4_9ACTN|nr:hypothetical protein [Streptantibioticus parmotrematis]MBY8888425.1 hypothetical protein [Streptantibioticus parmotrematis]
MTATPTDLSATATASPPPVPPTRRARLLTALGPTGIAAAVFLTVVLAVAAAAPLLAPSAPDLPSLLDAYAGPSGAHLLGTDGIGRDILSRLLYGHVRPVCRQARPELEPVRGGLVRCHRAIEIDVQETKA